MLDAGCIRWKVGCWMLYAGFDEFDLDAECYMLKFDEFDLDVYTGKLNGRETGMGLRAGAGSLAGGVYVRCRILLRQGTS